MVFTEINVEEMIQELRNYKRLVSMLDAVIECSYDGLWISDSTGKVVRINRACEKIAGVPARDVLGKSVQELVSEKVFDRSVTLEVLKRKKSVTMVQHTKNGRTLLVTGNPVFDERGEIAFVVTNDRDITELNRLKEQVEETRALNRRYCSELSSPQLEDLEKEGLVVRSRRMKRVLGTALRVAKVDSTVLITGESGVGKTLVAKLIHKNSDRAKGPFVRVQCNTIPESLMEAELFGYERGAFTGAKVEGKPGFFELAHRGTLFLDEIGEIPANVQIKLLRFLEENEIVRVGGTTERKINVRIVAASNRNLEEMISRETFRRDLFYRLNVLPIEIPPLRERRECIVPLIHFFLKKFNTRFEKSKTLSPEALDVLCHYHYAGNVRELSNVMERLVILSDGPRIELKDLPLTVHETVHSSISLLLQNKGLPLKKAVERLETALIKDALFKAGTQHGAAKILGVDQATIARKAKRYGITRSDVFLHDRGAAL